VKTRAHIRGPFVLTLGCKFACEHFTVVEETIILYINRFEEFFNENIPKICHGFPH